VTSVAVSGQEILAGTREGIQRSRDGGRSWNDAGTGLDIRYVRWLAYHPTMAGRAYAGTEPAGLFVTNDGGETWRGCPEVGALRDRFNWFLPYSPEAGCVRGFAFHGDRAYAAVEVGGLLRSDDAGETWRLADGSTGEPVFGTPATGLIHADVHSVEGHPSSADLVFAATAGGLFISSDGGVTWTPRHAGSYCRAVWVDPDDTDHLVLGPADGVSQNGRIEESRDGGTTWIPASDGLDLPWPDRMIERFAQVDETLYAVANDGRVFRRRLGIARWEQIYQGAEGVNALTTG
jgi:photosystem II stability/assembly factor-like uncharacterized protein